MGRYELSDEQWALIERLLPTNGHRGEPWKDHRRILNGIFWRVRTGAPWRDVPERYGPWQTVYDRFNRWRKDGTWDRIAQALQIRLDEEGMVDWDLWCVDGTNVRATPAAAGGGKRGDLQSQPTTRWVARAADGGASCTWSLTAEAFRWPCTLPRDKSTNPPSSKR